MAAKPELHRRTIDKVREEPARPSPSRSSPDEQGVTFVELFFDLVFVFAVTQVTGLLREDLTPAGIVRFVLVFWLIWWAWTQFTWALNAADTRDNGVQIATLVAVGFAFSMAMGVSRAYEGSGLWFALPYVAVRLVGLVIYLWVSVEHDLRRAAVRQFALWSSLGLLASLIGGVFPTPWRPILWGVAIVLDLVAATRSGGEGAWDVRPGHFVERHGLFVILALGESLIAVGVPTVDANRTPLLVATALAAVGVVVSLWWVYFAHTKPQLELVLQTREGGALSALARDAYSLLHFPLVGAIVAVAAALEEAVAHPGDPLPSAAIGSFAVGLALFLIVSAVIHRRAGHGWMAHRLAAVPILAIVILFVSGFPPVVSLISGVGCLIIVAVLDKRWFEVLGRRHLAA